MDSAKTLLSIIMPIFNLEKYLKSSLNSIFLENSELDKFEVVCVDDGSTDKSIEILNEYSKKYSNLRILSTGKIGGGPSNARNVGIENSVEKCSKKVYREIEKNINDSIVNWGYSDSGCQIIQKRLKTLPIKRLIPQWILNFYRNVKDKRR